MTNEEVDQVLFQADQKLRQAMGGGAAPGGQGLPPEAMQLIDAAVQRRVGEQLSMIPTLPGPKGQDGTSVTVEDVMPIIEDLVAQIPTPKDGKDGKDGKPGEIVRTLVRTPENRSSEVEFVQSGNEAKTHTVQRKLRERVSVFDFLDEADIEAIQAGTATNINTDLNAAVAELEDLPNPPLLWFPRGAGYAWDSVTLKQVEIVGEGFSRVTFDTQQAPTVCTQIVGATDHFIKFAYDNIATPRLAPGVRSMVLRGRREQNRRNVCRITAVGSRVSFTVNTTDLAAFSVASTDTANFPFFGTCYFWSAENRFLGHGLVEDINTGTGVVTVVTGWDNYGTKTGASQLLTATETVSLCSKIASSADSTILNRPDLHSAGYAAIQTDDTSSLAPQLEDLAIWGFHAAIARGGQLGLEARKIWTRNCTHGILRRTRARGSDDYIERVFMQGAYSRDFDLSAESGTFDNGDYRKAAAGLFGSGGTDEYNGVTVDASVNGFVDFGGGGASYEYLYLDQAVKYPWLTVTGSQSPSAEAHVGNLAIKAPGSIPSTFNHITGVSDRAAIVTVADAQRTLTVDHLSCFRAPADSDNSFAYLATLQTKGRLQIGSLVNADGFTALSSGSGDLYPLVGRYASIDPATAIGSLTGFYQHISGGVTLGTSAEDASALLLLASTTKGFRPPSMTKAQRDAISSPVAGLEVFQSDTGPGHRIYENGGWRAKTVVLAASAVAASGTVTTAEEARATISVPANAMGGNGFIRVSTVWTVTNGANDKIVRVRFGGTSGTQYMNVTLTTSATYVNETIIANRNLTNSQAGRNTNSNVFGGSSSAVVTSSVDTTAAVDLVISGQKEVDSETLTLESYIVELIVP